MRSAERASIGSLARLGDILTERLLLLLQVAVVGFTLLYLAVVWNLAESAGQAWSAVVDAGVQVGETRFTVGRLLLASLAVYLAVVISWVLRSLLDRAVFEHRRFDRGIRDSIATLLHYVLVVVGVFIALSVFGVDLSNLALIAGALSVGIGFGLQNVVNNFVSGLILLFERPVRVGDIVVLGTEQGTISKIGMRSTVLTTFNGAELIVPNGDLISQQVINWTLTTPRARLVLPVSVAYGNDPAQVIEMLEEIGAGYSLALDEPAPMAIFTGFGESSVDFELRVWLAAFDQLLKARSELAALVTRRFAEAGVEIPFPQRDLHVRSVGEGVTGALRPGRSGEAGAGPRPDQPAADRSAIRSRSRPGARPPARAITRRPSAPTPTTDPASGRGSTGRAAEDALGGLPARLGRVAGDRAPLGRRLLLQPDGPGREGELDPQLLGQAQDVQPEGVARGQLLAPVVGLEEDVEQDLETGVTEGIQTDLVRVLARDLARGAPAPAGPRRRLRSSPAGCRR